MLIPYYANTITKPMNRSWMLAPIIAWTAACAIRGQTTGPFPTAPAAVIERMRVLVVAPVSVAADVTIPDSILRHIESALVTQLRDAGVSVIPPSDYEWLWEEVYRASDPIFDPFTGQRNEEAYGRAWGRFYSMAASRFGARAVLFPELWEVEAEVTDGSARWDGTSQSMTSTGTKILAILDALVPNDDGQPDYDILPSGFVEALSLSIVVEDSSGTALYSQRSGIESLRTRITSDRLEESELFQDGDRLERAITRALAPLLEEFRREAQNDISEDGAPIATLNR